MSRLVPPVLDHIRMTSMAQPSLRHGDLVIRPFTAADAPSVLQAYSDPDIQRWHCRAMTSIEDAKDWISTAEAGWSREFRAEWAVESGAAVAGRVCLRHLDLIDGHAEVGYWVLPPSRGRGVAVRAVLAVRQWAFDELGLHRLELEHSVENTASCRVAEQAGFAAEGVRRAGVRHVDGWHDMHRHGCVAE